ncbi:hypothetical protein BDR03DRAFT_1019039 [Suillus americanus]|nr:hypothetical protein BDR03DRAFT_1019039 [Suillus americanus]
MARTSIWLGFREEEGKCSTLLPHQKSRRPDLLFLTYGPNIDLVLYQSLYHSTVQCYTILPHQKSRRPDLPFSTYGTDIDLGLGEPPTPKTSLPGHPVLDLWPDHRSGPRCPDLLFSTYGLNIDLGGLEGGGKSSTNLPDPKPRCPDLLFSTYGMIIYGVHGNCGVLRDRTSKVVSAVLGAALDNEKLVRDRALRAVELVVKHLEAHTLTMPFIGLLDPTLHTSQSIFQRCPFLFTVICVISSRYYKEKFEIYPVAMRFAKHSAANALIDAWKSVELCQAYILMSIYAVPARRWEEDRSWLYT